MTTATQGKPQVDDALRARVAKAITLQESTELLGLRAVMRVIGVNGRHAQRYLEIATRNYFQHGWGIWPPTVEILRRSLPSAEHHPRPLTDWPYHPGVLPPFEVGGADNPRWLAGTIYRWAMVTGRVDIDGNPTKPKGPGGRRKIDHDHPPLDHVDLRLWEALVGDTSLWTVADISASLQCGVSVVQHWSRAMRGMRNGGLEWPPDKEAARRVVKPAPGNTVAEDWPAHPGVLPPPVDWGSDTRTDGPWNERPRPRWRAGDIRAWAMLVGRMQLDGTPLTT